MAERFEVDPRTLHVRPRTFVRDPSKLQRQIARYGSTTAGMPPIEVYRGSDGELVIYDGETRATCIAKLSPGTLVPVEVVDELRKPVGDWPILEDQIP